MKTGFLRWWWIERASSMLHKAIRFEMRASRHMCNGETIAADICYVHALFFRNRDLEYRRKLHEIDPEGWYGPYDQPQTPWPAR